MVRPLEWCLPGAGVVPDLPFGSALPTMCRVTAATFSALHASLSSLSSTCYSLVSLLSFQHDSSGAAISSNAPLCEWPFEPGILTAPGVSPSDRAGPSLCRSHSPTCPALPARCPSAHGPMSALGTLRGRPLCARVSQCRLFLAIPDSTFFYTTLFFCSLPPGRRLTRVGRGCDLRLCGGAQRARKHRHDRPLLSLPLESAYVRSSRIRLLCLAPFCLALPLHHFNRLVSRWAKMYDSARAPSSDGQARRGGRCCI